MIALLLVCVLATAPDAGGPGGWREVPRAATAEAQLDGARAARAAMFGREGEALARARRAAVAAYRAVRHHFPGRRGLGAEAAFRAGELLRAGGDGRGALGEFRTVLRLRPGGALACRARLEIAHLHRRAGRPELALAVYDALRVEARAAGRDCAVADEAALWTGRLLADAGRPAEARAIWLRVARAARRATDRVRAYDRLAESWLDAGEPRRAERVLAECDRRLAELAREVTRRGERVRGALERMRARRRLKRDPPSGSAGRMRVRMPWGEEGVELELPEGFVAGHHRVEPHAGSEAGFETGLAELAAAGLADAVRGLRVGLLVNDGTRDPVLEGALPGLLPLLTAARELRVLVATGTHDPALPETLALVLRLEAALAAREPGAPPGELHVNDARGGTFRSFGRTLAGTPVELAEEADACEAFVALSDMKFHYFAGYSNPVKAFVPGMASFETARANHSLALDESARFGLHPWHLDPARRANPLAEDMVEALGRLAAGRPCFALAAVTGAGAVLWSGGGEVGEVAGRGMDEVDRRASLALEPQRYLVVSAGGHPFDESLYSAQRALELCQAAARPGGEVLFLARCPNGVGPASARENFFEPLAQPLERIAAPPRAGYAMYAHKPVRFARCLRRLGTVHLASHLPPEEVRRIHMEPAPDPRAVVERWLREAGPDDRVHLIDDGSKVAVV